HAFRARGGHGQSLPGGAGSGARELAAATASVGGPGAAARAGVPGAARAGVDMEQTETVVLEAAHGLLAKQEAANRGGIGRDAEIDGVAGQMVGARGTADPRVVRLAA